MGPVIALVVALVVSLVAVRVLHRRRRDEIRSIEHYHDRLDTLHVEPHDRGGSVRLVRGEVTTRTLHEPDRPRLDPDAANLDTAATAGRADARRGRHDREWALDRMQPRARVDTATTLIVAIVIAALIAIALAGYLIQRGRGSTATSTSTTTTTIRPTSYQPLHTVSGGIVVYALPASTYTVSVSGESGAVWVAASSLAGAAHAVGHVVAKGTTATYTFTAASSVKLGAPASASVSIDGAPVVFPSPAPAPLTLQFAQP